MARPLVSMTGPFFRGDPVKTFRQNIRDLMVELTEASERDVKERMRPANVTGYTSSRVVGRTRAISGKPWAVTAVVSANTAGLNRRQAIRVKAAASVIESRRHPFRRAATGTRRHIKTDLAKGLE